MESTTHLGLHSQTTRLYEYGPSSRCFRFLGPTGLSPSSACRSKSTSGSQAVDRDSPPLQTTIRPAVTIADREISDLGFFPLRSPLLRESLLVSLPPLIDMLKFSGWVSLDLRPQINDSNSRSERKPRAPRRTAAAKVTLRAPVSAVDSANLAFREVTPRGTETVHTYEVHPGRELGNAALTKGPGSRHPGGLNVAPGRLPNRSYGIGSCPGRHHSKQNKTRPSAERAPSED